MSRLGRECWKRREVEGLIQQVDAQAGSELLENWLERTSEEKASLTMNALQLSEVYPVQRGKHLHVMPQNEEVDLILALVLPVVSDLVVTYGPEISDGADAVVTQSVQSAFDGVQFCTGGITDGRAFPVFTYAGRVLSLGMPDPPGSERQFEQLGTKPGAVGRLLPGYQFNRTGEGSLTLTTPHGESFVLEGSIDPDGFLTVPQV